jgi:hypothetical protein
VHGMKEEGKGYILRLRKQLSEGVWELRGRERELSEDVWERGVAP